MMSNSKVSSRYYRLMPVVQFHIVIHDRSNSQTEDCLVDQIRRYKKKQAQLAKNLIYFSYKNVLPLLKGIGASALVTGIVQAAVLAQRWQRVPRRSLVTTTCAAGLRSENSLTRTGAQRRAARAPTIGMAEPLCASRFTNTCGATWSGEAMEIVTIFHLSFQSYL